ncbi:MAG: CBS domain-containing protein [Myxococcales bacterium]|jgi:CBS domain-containing protein
MRCEELMKRDVRCITEGDTVQDAAAKMADDNIGFLPVCDEKGRPIGTLTDRDIAIRVAAEDRLASGTPVKQVMTREVVACSPYDDLSVAEELMAKNHKSRILVIGDDGKLVGVISLSDLPKAAGAEAAFETMRRITEREAHP